MIKDEKRMHEGHRERLIELVEKVGFENVSEVQSVETFLTFIYPRGDVNPLAHRLLDVYGDFTHIVDATVNDLKKIKGINTRAAKKITMFADMFFYYATSKMRKKFKINCKGEIIDAVEDYLRFRNAESIILIAISAGNYVTHTRRITKDESCEVGIPVYDLTDFMSMAKPATMVVAHCHPYGTALPSKDDDRALEIIDDLCKTCGVNLIDSYIVGDDGVYGQKEQRMMRKYVDIDQLRNSLIVK